MKPPVLPRSLRCWSLRDVTFGGFTLIEMLVTLAVAAVLLGIGIPSFSSFVKNQGVKTAARDVASALLFARSEAIKRNANVVITANTGGWQNGWTVSTSVGGTSTNLATQAGFSNATVDGPSSAITYGGNGRIQNTSLPEFEISGSSSTRCVALTLTGLPNTRSGACS